MERNNISLSQTVWWIERDSVCIVYYDAGAGKFTNHTDTSKLVSLLYIQRPDKFLIPDETPERDGFVAGDTYLETILASDAKVSDATYKEQATEIPEQFHETLVARVIANGYERKVETIPLAQYYMQKYEAGVKKGRAYAFRGRDGSTITRVQVDF
tara:strand:- start:723 stop:1190 length:468 start_codon:yes stop_codon:yes gene_type:complete